MPLEAPVSTTRNGSADGGRTVATRHIDQRVAHRQNKVEIAKHRLFYTLLKLRLPLTTRPEDPDGLAFDFIADQPSAAPVMTGHVGGLITINLSEADDSERERQRSQSPKTGSASRDTSSTAT